MRRDALLRSLAEALAADPINHGVRQLYAHLLIEAGHGPEALGHCDVLLAALPDDPEILSLSQRAAALADTQYSSLRIDVPDNVDAFLHRCDQSVGTLPRIGRLSTPTTGLDDLGGIDDTKTRLREVLSASPDHDGPAGLRGLGRLGCTLYGPRGCGKSALVEAIATELGADLFVVPLGEVVTAWLAGESDIVRHLVDVATSRARCVVHLQDLDVLWGGSISHSTIERALIVESLARALDTLEAPSLSVTVIATSHLPWKLPAALMTPRRLGTGIFVPPPDLGARAQILWDELNGAPRGEMDVWAIARHTDGFSASELQTMCRVAADAAAPHHPADIAVPTTTASVLAASGSIDRSVTKWAGHARIALATRISNLALEPLADWLADVDAES